MPNFKTPVGRVLAEKATLCQKICDGYNFGGVKD